MSRDRHLALEISIQHKLFTVHNPAPGQEAGEQEEEREKKESAEYVSLKVFSSGVLPQIHKTYVLRQNRACKRTDYFSAIQVNSIKNIFSTSTVSGPVLGTVRQCQPNKGGTEEWFRNCILQALHMCLRGRTWWGMRAREAERGVPSCPLSNPLPTSLRRSALISSLVPCSENCWEAQCLDV